jgi:hypothetical protein
MPNYLERYDAGQRREVWDELHALGSLDGAPAELRRDVADVANRTMDRAARNVATLYGRLTALGYVFDLPEHARVPPNAAVAADERALIAKAGPLPASLTAWLRIVGVVSFRGHLPSAGTARSWYRQLVDPLEFLPDVQSEIERLAEIEGLDEDEVDEEERDFQLVIAADVYHKNDFSGGGPTMIPLPSDEADARIVEDGDDAPWRPALVWFVDYVRAYFEAGGFRRVAATVSYPDEIVRDLADGLLEI